MTAPRHYPHMLAMVVDEDRAQGEDEARAARVAAAQRVDEGSPLIAAIQHEDAEVDRLLEAARVKYGRSTPLYRQVALSLFALGPTPGHYAELGVEP